MRKTFKYKLYPSASQRTAMRQSLGACRWVYNKALETRKEAWEQRQENVSRYDTTKMIPNWKREHSFLMNVYSQCLQETCKRVDFAFRAFFRRVKAGQKPGYPRFKSKNRYDSFTYPQLGFKLLDNGRLHLSKIGDVKIKLHRLIEGQIKTLTIRRDTLGNWWACFSCIIESKPLPPTDQVVGVDVGLTYFATLSTGEQIDNPRFFRRDERKLTKAQRKFSACKKGTKECRKHKRVIQHICVRIANRRRDFAHKVSRRLVNKYQLIAFEDLNIQEMQQNNFRGMNKSIGDAAWNQLRQFTSNKAEEAGRVFVAVDPRGTSQECSGCNKVVRKDLSVRIHKCSHCGLEIDRDENAALNILARGLSRRGLIPKSSFL